MEFFNERDKIEFLNNSGLTNESKRKYKYLFSTYSNFEIFYNKDIYDFDTNEALYLLYSLNQRSYHSITNIKVRISAYTNWAITNNKTKSNQNIWKELKINSKMVVNKAANTLIKDRTEFLRLINDYVDHAFRKLTLFMLYEGFIGTEYSEIRFALDTDLNLDEKTLHVVRNDMDCYLPVSNEFIKAYKLAEILSLYDNLTSPYIIKNRIKGQAISSSVVNKHVYNLLDKIAHDTGHRPEYTATSIWKSGMYDYIHRLETENGSLTDDILKTAAARYGYVIYNKLYLLRKEYALYKEAFNL